MSLSTSWIRRCVCCSRLSSSSTWSGSGLSFRRSIRSTWDSEPASALADHVIQALPNAFAWPVRATWATRRITGWRLDRDRLAAVAAAAAPGLPSSAGRVHAAVQLPGRGAGDHRGVPRRVPGGAPPRAAVPPARTARVSRAGPARTGDRAFPGVLRRAAGLPAVPVPDAPGDRLRGDVLPDASPSRRSRGITDRCWTAAMRCRAGT